MAALEFHHVAPDDKRFSLSHRGVTRSIARARAEASKCVLLCANCHAEVEAGIAKLTLPDRLLTMSPTRRRYVQGSPIRGSSMAE
jgi:hypothetical protein